MRSLVTGLVMSVAGGRGWFWFLRRSGGLDSSLGLFMICHRSEQFGASFALSMLGRWDERIPNLEIWKEIRGINVSFWGGRG